MNRRADFHPPVLRRVEFVGHVIKGPPLTSGTRAKLKTDLAKKSQKPEATEIGQEAAFKLRDCWRTDTRGIRHLLLRLATQQSRLAKSPTKLGKIHNLAHI